MKLAEVKLLDEEKRAILVLQARELRRFMDMLVESKGHFSDSDYDHIDWAMQAFDTVLTHVYEDTPLDAGALDVGATEGTMFILTQAGWDGPDGE